MMQLISTENHLKVQLFPCFFYVLATTVCETTNTSLHFLLKDEKVQHWGGMYFKQRFLTSSKFRKKNKDLIARKFDVFLGVCNEFSFSGAFFSLSARISFQVSFVGVREGKIMYQSSRNFRDSLPIIIPVLRGGASPGPSDVPRCQPVVFWDLLEGLA